MLKINNPIQININHYERDEEINEHLEHLSETQEQIYLKVLDSEDYLYYLDYEEVYYKILEDDYTILEFKQEPIKDYETLGKYFFEEKIGSIEEMKDYLDLIDFEEIAYHYWEYYYVDILKTDEFIICFE